MDPQLVAHEVRRIEDVGCDGRCRRQELVHVWRKNWPFDAEQPPAITVRVVAGEAAREAVDDCDVEAGLLDVSLYASV